MKQQEIKQQQHYDTISVSYDTHYNDFWSNLYLRSCVIPRLFQGITFSDKTVMDAMCGTGQVTGFLKNKGAKNIIGVDISKQQLKQYQDYHSEATGVCASVTQLPQDACSVDIVIISGGLHHVHPDVNKAVAEFYRVLKPAGILCFSEPHNKSILDDVRQWWYKKDPLFEDNEAAIDVAAIKNDFCGKFECVKEDYIGTIGHFFVLNSMIFRIPVWLKWIYSPLFIAIEWILNFFPQKFIASNVLCQLKKI